MKFHQQTKKFFIAQAVRNFLKFSCIGIFFFLSCNKKDSTLKVYFAGDLLLDRGVRQQIDIHGVPHIFENIKKLFKDGDVVIANLECPVCDQISPVNKKYIFRGEPIWLKEIKNAGITHLIMANNHTYDQGRNGIKETANNLMQNGLIPVGYGNNQNNACEPVLIEKNDQKVALFASVILPLENWTYLSDSVGICQASINDLAEKIKKFKVVNRNYKVIVSLHWGAEFQLNPTIEQRMQAQQLVEAGADAIVGHHPHVIQTYSIYNDKLVFFSIGNFVFDQKTDIANEAQIIELNFSEEKDDFKIHPIKIKNCVPHLN